MEGIYNCLPFFVLNKKILFMKNIFYFILVLCVACTNDAVQQNQPSKISPAELFNTYYEDLAIPEMKNIAHYNGDYYIPLLDKNLKSYQQKKYGEAIAGLSETAKKTPQQAQSLVRTYWGLCCINLDLNKEALVKFNEVDPNSDYGQQALWYKALTYLKMGNSDAARSDLSRLAAIKGAYKQAEAKAILERL